MLKLLLKKQLFEIFRSYFYDAKKNKARSRLATALYIGLFVLLMAGILGGIFTLLAVKLCGPLAAAGLGWLYFALMGLIAVLLGAFGSIFNTYAGLYLPKDNDLLLSMPVPVSSLVAARLSGVYLMGLMYSAVVILPAVIIYWVTVGVTASAVLGGLVLTLLISLAVLVLSCALGWVAAKISQKLRNKSLVVVLASLVFIGLYYFVYFKAQSVLQDLLANAGTYGAQIRSRAYPLYLFGSVGTGSGAAMLAVTAAGIVLFSVLAWRYNALLSGEETAVSLGIHVQRLTLTNMVLCCLTCSIIVSRVGLINFIGLVAPHIVRMVVGNNHVYLIPGSVLAGAVLLLLGDLFARVAMMPIILPIGAITSFLGGPLFLYLLFKGGTRK